MKLLVRKPNFTWNSHSRSFYVIHFATNHRAIRGIISPYNIAGLISEVFEEVATQVAKSCSRQPPHSHLRPRPKELRRMSACALYFQKRESLAYIFVADIVGLSLSKLVQCSPKHASFLCQSAFRPFKVVQCHPRSVILVPIESAFTPAVQVQNATQWNEYQGSRL